MPDRQPLVPRPGSRPLPRQTSAGDASQIRSASSLAANQARDRFATDRGQKGSTGGELAADLGHDEPVFLELPVQSYAAGATEEQRETSRQRAMLETARRFVEPAGPVPSEVTAQEGQRGEVPTAAGPAGAAPAGGATQQAQVQAMLQQGQQASRAEEEQQRLRQLSEAAGKFQKQRQEVIRISNMTRNVMKAVQVAGGVSIVTILTLIIQVNLETLNKWITKIRIPFLHEVEPNPTLGIDDGFTCCVNCIVAYTCFISMAQAIFVIIIIGVMTAALTQLIGPIYDFFRPGV